MLSITRTNMRKWLKTSLCPNSLNIYSEDCDENIYQHFDRNMCRMHKKGNSLHPRNGLHSVHVALCVGGKYCSRVGLWYWLTWHFWVKAFFYVFFSHIFVKFIKKFPSSNPQELLCLWSGTQFKTYPLYCTFCPSTSGIQKYKLFWTVWRFQNIFCHPIENTQISCYYT